MRLEYDGKLPAKDVIENTLAAVTERVHAFGDKNEEWSNRLYHADNLPVLKSLTLDPDVKGKVRLVYIDPPYASKQSFQHRDDEDAHAYHDILGGAAFIEALRQRLILLRELLTPDGTLYLHLDGNMAFHLKVIMDEVFGEAQFRNFITRKKCHSKNYTKNQFGNISDYILVYSKSAKMQWNRPYEQENIYTFDERYPKIDPETKRRYALVPIYAKGVRNGETGQPWRGMEPPAGKHWQPKPSELDRLDAIGDINWSATGNPRRKIWADNDKGVPVGDMWTQFMDFQNQNMNETGYPTEKNPALLRRIIEASSAPGDLVLDCYCGSGTTLAVARDLGRRWIGVDEGELAIRTTTNRLQVESASKQKKGNKAAIEQEQLALIDAHSAEPEVRQAYRSFVVYKQVTNVSSLLSDAPPTF